MSAVPALLHPFAKPARTDFDRIVGGEGAHVWDDRGRRYVDAMGSLWYCNVGHGRAEIADAVAAQLRTLDAFHLFERFTNPPAEALADRLADLAPMPGARVFFTSGGSEAVDSALKLVRLARPGRTIVVSRTPSYHGVTYGATTLTGLAPNRAGVGPLVDDVVQVGKDDLEATAALFAEHGDRIAAVFAEPVVGAGGVYPPAPGYLSGLRDLCDRYGALLVLDEVISGFGRLGTWWGAQRYGVTPDLVTFAKAVTSGYQPLGGVLVGRAVRAALEADPDLVLRTGHTYSGHPAACAAGLTVLAITQREGLVDRATVVGDRLGAGLAALAADGLVAEARGDGAVRAVGLHPDADAVTVRDAMLAGGVIVRPIGTSTIAFCPPLVIDLADVDRCVGVLADALGGLGRKGD